MPVLKNAKHAARSFYVYELADPRTDSVFYVGKGKGDRLRQHVAAVRLNREKNAAKCLRIVEILNAGLSVIERKVCEGLTEAEAYAREREMISQHGLSRLTNVSRGELTGIERSRLRAKAMLATLKPRQQWLTERHRSADEIRIADTVRAELAKIAERGYASEAIAGPNGIEVR